MAQFSFRVGLCATGFSRFCSLSEHSYYGTFSRRFQSLTCSKNRLNRHAPFEARIGFVDAYADSIENIAARLGESAANLGDRAGQFEVRKRIRNDRDGLTDAQVNDFQFGDVGSLDKPCAVIHKADGAGFGADLFRL